MSAKTYGDGDTTNCGIPGCRHAWSMHNELGYCRSRTTPDRSGECICDSTFATARAGWLGVQQTENPHEAQSNILRR